MLYFPSFTRGHNVVLCGFIHIHNRADCLYCRYGELFYHPDGKKSHLPEDCTIIPDIPCMLPSLWSPQGVGIACTYISRAGKPRFAETLSIQ